MAQIAPNTPVADVLVSADRLIRQHGKDAPLVAEMQAEQMLIKGDVEGYRTWKRIELVVDGLTGGLGPGLPH